MVMRDARMTAQGVDGLCLPTEQMQHQGKRTCHCTSTLTCGIPKEGRELQVFSTSRLDLSAYTT